MTETEMQISKQFQEEVLKLKNIDESLKKTLSENKSGSGDENE